MNAGDRFWIVGCGAMAGAMLARWIEDGADPTAFTVIDPGTPNAPTGVRAAAELPVEPPPEWLMLGIKPQLLGAVAPAVAAAIGPGTTLVSILAGVPRAALAQRFPGAGRIVRAMPNLPVRIGRGVVALCGDGDRAAVDRLMAPLGLVEWIDETHFDAVTALSGSGPALVYRYADALAAGGASLGLDPALADRLARATLHGATTLAASSAEALAVLADRVASKGGSTREGLDVLDRDDALRRLVAEALVAAAARNRQLGS